ncbi:competence protein ComK [Ureibacillus manganicus]|uniref:Competence protein ComK n=1 Tax=Ureibacillus manganicus DSM 26584 TaxID=1384049 RepID=A0A0A3ICP6_9BACL|nr:competence protein ComK [Ureibacillus manganicus]KGR80593.1 hypothetical protein CD29_01530 [Ureibacillus manganicus DSM 26584]
MSKLKPVNSYYLSFNSYLIEPIQHGDKLYSRVYDKSGEVVVSRKPLYIIRKSCDLMGSRYNAAREVSKNFLGPDKHKLPIIIAYDYGVPLVFFPILSPTSPSNVWVGLHSIINIQQDMDQTKITLKDDREIILQVPQSSFNNQYVRATMLQKHASNQRLIIQNAILL